MMKYIFPILLFLSLGSCSILSPIPQKNQYALEASPPGYFTKTDKACVLQVSPMQDTPTTQGTALRYIEKNYELSAFAKNQWVAPPADLLYPLLLEQMQASGAFEGVVSGFEGNPCMRLNTTLLALYQDFRVHPSVITLRMQAQLIFLKGKQAPISQQIVVSVQAQDTPYGGVVAANGATQIMLEKLIAFVVNQKAQGHLMKKRIGSVFLI